MKKARSIIAVVAVAVAIGMESSAWAQGLTDCPSKPVSITLEVGRYAPGNETPSGRPSWKLVTTSPDQVATGFWVNPTDAQQRLPDVGAQIHVRICPEFLKEPLANKSWYIEYPDRHSTYRIEEVDRNANAAFYEEASMGEENKQYKLDLSHPGSETKGFDWIGGIRFWQSRATVEQILLRQGFQKLECSPWFDDVIKSYIDTCTTHKNDKFLGLTRNINTGDEFSVGYGLQFRLGRLVRIVYEFPQWRYLHMLAMLTARYGEPEHVSGNADWDAPGDAMEFILHQGGNGERPTSTVTILSNGYYYPDYYR